MMNKNSSFYMFTWFSFICFSDEIYYFGIEIHIFQVYFIAGTIKVLAHPANDSIIHRFSISFHIESFKDGATKQQLFSILCFRPG